MASFFRSLGRAVGVGVPKINANLKSNGTFGANGYTKDNKTRKNTRFTEINSKVRPMSSKAEYAMNFVMMVRNAYEALSYVKTRESIALARQFNMLLNANILLFDISEGYKNELRAYNNFLNDYWLNQNFDKQVKNKAEQTAILQQWSEELSNLTRDAVAASGPNETDPAVNELMARAAEMARLTKLGSMPTPPKGGQSKTRKTRRRL
jgi:hypothetical protein